MPINKNREDYRFYKIWTDMKTRCNNPKCKKYNLYGGRGISVSEFWNKYDNFKNDMYTSYKKHVLEFGEKETTLDRINPDKNYTLDNCQWATNKQQRLNIRDKEVYEAFNPLTGEKFIFNNCADFCKKNGFTRQRVFACMGKQKQHKGFVFRKVDKKDN